MGDWLDGALPMRTESLVGHVARMVCRLGMVVGGSE